MIEAPDTNILVFPAASREDVERLWADFQAAVAVCDEAALEARAAGERFRAAFLSWERRL